MVLFLYMGIRVQHALLSSLLIAALFCAPYLHTVRADEEIASSTEAITNEQVASSTEQVQEVASSTETTFPEATTTEEGAPDLSAVQDPAITTSEGASTTPAEQTAATITSARTYNTQSDQPVFLTEEIYFPFHELRRGSRKEKLTALKDGTQTYLTVLINQAPTTVSVTADISALGGSSTYSLQDVYDYVDQSTGTNVIHQFQGDWFSVQSSSANGTITIPITATDENGDVLTSSISVTLDNTPPTLTIDSVSRTATSTLIQGDSLYFTGTLDGSGTTGKLYSVKMYEVASDGTTTINQIGYDATHPATPEFYALRNQGFSTVPIRIYTAEYTDTFPETVAYVQYVFTVDDDAGNLIYATSSLVSIQPPPPEPEGPKISNVLFLPGIKGSRLYSDETRCVLSICNNKLWDPASSEDVTDLYLTSDGKSSRSDIYAKEGDIIDAIPTKKIYASFIEDMNALQASSTYNGGKFKWSAAAYDWRLSLNDIITNGVERDGKIYYEEASSTPYIEQTLRQLVASSTTGKVTIIAHSNGGLVAKALLQKLGDAETAKLIDKIIFVGVPQSGAPQALGALLFGDREGLPFDILPIIATPAVARGLAEYSPMAYHLMPSARYLNDTQDPTHSVIGFSGSVLYGHELSAYGPSIDTITELDNFLLAREGGRVKPEIGDSTSANILNAGLITYANTTHDSLDSWTPPEGVTLYQIAGWGANTISGVDFYDEQKTLGVTVGYKRQYRPIFVEDGDGVVPVPSALLTSAASNVHDYWLNLKAISEKLRVNYDHGSIFETVALRTFIKSKIESIDSPSQFIVSTQPSETSQDKKLIFQLHSPLTLGIYDSAGNYTGLNSDGSVSENVPSAEYGEFGDVKYLIAPSGQEYILSLHGQSEGTFSLDIQEQTGNTVTTSTTIAGVPTTAQTKASLTITNGVADASSLTVDEDGNGSTDIELTPAAGETTTYSAPAAEVADTSTGTSSGTRPTSQSSAELVTVATTNPATVFQTPAVAQSRKQAYTVVSTQIQDPIFEGTTASSAPKQSHTQTASVYDAFAPFAEFIKSLLYNLWSKALALVKYFHL